VISRGFHGTGEWALAFPEPRKLKVTAVVAGHCWISIAGESCELRAGDVVVLDGRFTYTLSSSPGMRGRYSSTLFSASDEAIVPVGDGDSDEDTLVIGGHIDLGQAGEEFLLPDIEPFNVVDRGAASAAKIAWLLNALLDEMSGQAEGSRFALEHLTQLLLLDVLRAIAAESTVARASGWLRGLTDPHLAPAMRLMHSQPGLPWNLSELARVAAMSRSSFAERFRTVTGRTPMGYLQRWRLHLAQDALRSTNDSVDEIAQRLGYASSSSFTNSFKRVTGLAPSHYRRATLGQREVRS
jgi:AraC-like DNA-binding protein